MKYYRQCLLIRSPRPPATEQIITWIPEEHAVLGKTLTFTKFVFNDGFKCILEAHESPEKNYWKVTEIYSRLDEESVLLNSQDYKRTRKASDI